MLTYATSDDSFTRLHAAGWTVGDVAALTDTGRVWIVTGTNGENRIEARGATQDQTWHNAVLQAKGGPVLSEDGRISHCTVVVSGLDFGIPNNLL